MTVPDKSRTGMKFGITIQSVKRVGDVPNQSESIVAPTIATSEQATTNDPMAPFPNKSIHLDPYNPQPNIVREGKAARSATASYRNPASNVAVNLRW